MIPLSPREYAAALSNPLQMDVIQGRARIVRHHLAKTVCVLRLFNQVALDEMLKMLEEEQTLILRRLDKIERDRTRLVPPKRASGCQPAGGTAWTIAALGSQQVRFSGNLIPDPPKMSLRTGEA